MPRYDEITMEEFRELAERCDVAIIPVGALEVHGSHGPLGFDNFVAEEIARRIADRLGCLLLPTIPYGCCRLVYDATNYPGTLSISPETMTQLCTEIGKELARQGFRRLLFVNGHFGNSPALLIASYKIWCEAGAAVGVLEYWVAAQDLRARLFERPGHAGESETSLLLATPAARHLKMERASVNLPQDSEAEREVKGAGIRSYTRWMPSPSYGDPRRASREKGEKVIELTVERGLRLLEALKGYVRVSGSWRAEGREGEGEGRRGEERGDRIGKGKGEG